MDINLKKIDLPNGETLGYRERKGGDELLVLLHGNLTSSKHWDIFMENFNEDYKLIAPDMRGFGISSYNQEIDSIADFTHDFELFIEKLGLEKFYLMGWSTGGCVAMKFTANNPGYVKKLLLLESISTRGNPLFKLDENGNILFDQRIKTQKEIAEDKFNIRPTLEAIENHNKKFMMTVWNNLIYTNNQPEPEKYDEYLEDMFTQRNVVEVYHALNHFNISDKHNGLNPGTGEATQINIPTLIFWGNNDRVAPRNMAEEILEDIGDNAKIETLNGCGHSPLIDDLPQLMDKVNSFLAD